MNRTKVFADVLADELAEVLVEVGVELPVYGLLCEAEASCDRIEVRVGTVEELIPGNSTMRLDGEVCLMMGCMGRDEKVLFEVAGKVSAAVRRVMAGRKKYSPLVVEGAGEEYEAAPFLLLYLCPKESELAVEDEQWKWELRYSAYVQF
jgi:hypothetical protein